MSRNYYKQAKFAGSRFQAKGEAIKSHEAAYLQAKQTENFAKPGRTLGKASNRLERVEIFGQCWDCLSVVIVWEGERGQYVRCDVCGGGVEVLTVNGRPV